MKWKFALDPRRLRWQKSLIQRSISKDRIFLKISKFIFSRRKIRIFSFVVVRIHLYIYIISQKWYRTLQNSFVPLCYTKNWFTRGKLSWTCNGTPLEIEDSHFPSWDTYGGFILCSRNERQWAAIRNKDRDDG